MTFRLEHHNKILKILESLNPEVLKKGSAYFGERMKLFILDQYLTM